MKRSMLYSLGVVVLASLFLFNFVGASPARAATFSKHEQNIAQGPGIPACSASLSPDISAGGNRGYSLPLHVSWTDYCSTSSELEIGWGDGTGWFWYGLSGFSGSGTYYHTYKNDGSYTVTWKLWAEEFGGNVLVATAYTYISIVG